LDRHLIPFFGDTPLSKLSTFDLERYKKNRLSELALHGGDRVSQHDRETGTQAGAKVSSTAPGTVNREIAALSHLFTKAVEWGWIDHKPAKVKRFKVDNGRVTYLTTEQIDRLLKTAREDQSPDIYPFIVIGLETSMRKMEVLSIRLEHIDLARRTIYIPKAKPVRGNSRSPATLRNFSRATANRPEEPAIPARPKLRSAVKS